MTILRARTAWTKPRDPNATRRSSDLTPAEQNNVRTAIRFLRTRLGGMRADCLDIGIVNNMPDAALEATERQFVELLASASKNIVIRLRFFSLPDITEPF